MNLAVLPASPLPGLTIEAEIGRGGAGTVYRARQTWLDRVVALKLLHAPAEGEPPGATERFEREARLLASLQHPNIVTCHQAGVTPEGQAWIVMELVEGPDLQRWIREHGPLPPGQAVALVRDLAAGLRHAHAKGIIHRDVKPENVLLAPKPEAAADDSFPWTPKLADLGLARNVGHAVDMRVTQPGTVVGTPTSMAPEQFEDPASVDHRADIYGLGCILVCASTGRHPFTATTLNEILGHKFGARPPAALREVQPSPVRRLATDMLARERDERPATYTRLIERCDAAIAAPVGRQPWRLALVVAAVGAVALLALVLRPTSPAPARPTATPPVTSVPPPPRPVVPASPPAPTPAPVPTAWGETRELLTNVRSGLPDWDSGQASHGPCEEGDGLILGQGWLERQLPSGPLLIQAVLRRAPGLRCDTAVVGVRLVDGTVAGAVLQDLDQHTLTQTAIVDAGNHVVQTAASPELIATPATWHIELVVLSGRMLVRIDGRDLPAIDLAAAPQRLAIAHLTAELGTRGAVRVERVTWSTPAVAGNASPGR